MTRIPNGAMFGLTARGWQSRKHESSMNGRFLLGSVIGSLCGIAVLIGAASAFRQPAETVGNGGDRIAPTVEASSTAPSEPAKAEAVAEDVPVESPVMNAAQPESMAADDADNSAPLPDRPALPLLPDGRALLADLGKSSLEAIRGRLDRMAGQSETAEKAEAATAALRPSADTTRQPENLRPLDRYARPFAPDPGKPRLAIVLIDTGESDLDREALANLPFPISFALDSDAEDSANNAEIYRKAGQEIIILMSDLPRDARPSDVEIAFTAMEHTLPESVAVMNRSERPLQSERRLIDLVMPIIGESGRGFLAWETGLNTASKIATREGVPTARIARDLDAAGESASAIRHSLDREAFKAAQSGRAIVAGRTRPETIAAVSEWVAGGQTGSLDLAPVSAMLDED